MAKSKRAKSIPIYKEYIVKNPNTLFPVDWVAMYGEDRVSFEDEPIFDNQGNYIETRRNVYVAMRKLTGFYRVKDRKQNCNSIIKQKPLFELKGDKENEHRG